MSCMTTNGLLRFCALIPAFLCIIFCGLSADAGTIVSGNVVVDIKGETADMKQAMTDQVVIPILEDGSFDMKDVASGSSGSMWMGTVGSWGNVDPFTNLAYSVTNNL